MSNFKHCSVSSLDTVLCPKLLFGKLLIMVCEWVHPALELIYVVLETTFYLPSLTVHPTVCITLYLPQNIQISVTNNLLAGVVPGWTESLYRIICYVPHNRKDGGGGWISRILVPDLKEIQEKERKNTFILQLGATPADPGIFAKINSMAVNITVTFTSLGFQKASNQKCNTLPVPSF